MTVFGAQYYRPPNPPREDWDRDLGRMRDAGFNTVKLWACWSWMEQREDDIDFADLDELMDLAAAHDLRVVINVILEDAPYWLEERHPEARYLDAEGRAVQLTAAMNTPGGGWPGLCFDNPPVREAAHRFLAAVVARYDAHPALDVFDVWNEPHLEPASYYPERIYCYCDASLARFGAWLRSRYETVGALNAAWERRYSAWSQVLPPRIFESLPDLIDWREFWFATLAGWLDDRVATARSAARPGRSIMTHVALSGFTGQLATHTLDEFTLTGSIDVYGTSTFPTWLMADDHVEHWFNLETARDAAAGKPFWQAELQGGRGRRNGLESTGQPDPAVLALWMWNALAAGASGVMFWQWRPELLGPESPGYGLTAPDGEVTSRVAAASSVVSAAAGLDGFTVEPGSIGLLLSRKSALHAWATDRTMELYTRAALGAYRLLLDGDVTVTVLHEDFVERDGVPSHVDAVYWPMPAVASEGLASKLSAFVERGGRLVAESGPGEYTPLGRRRTVVPGAGLDALFGVREVESTATAGVTIGGLPMGWQVAAHDPQITEHSYGEGTAVLLPGFPSVVARDSTAPGAPAALRTLLGIQGDGRWRDPRPGLISRKASLEDGQPIRFLLNWTSETAHYGETELPPKSARILKE